MIAFNSTMFYWFHRDYLISDAFVSTVCLFVCILLLTRKTNGAAFRASAQQRLMEILSIDWPIIKVFRVFCDGLTSAFFLIGIGLSIQAIFWFGGITLGLFMDGCGAFEAGERIFAAIPAHPGFKDDISLTATWIYDRCRAGSPTQDAQIVRAIEKVYGVQSPQVAHQYTIRGEKYRCAAVTDLHAGREQQCKPEFHQALSSYGKALEIYRSLGNNVECIDSLSNIAYCQIKLGLLKESLEALRESNKLIEECHGKGVLSGSLNRLGLVAYYAGNDSESSRYYNIASKLPDTAVCKTELDWAWLPVVFLVALGTKNVANLFLRAVLGAYWRHCLLSAPDELLAHHFWDRLITLELSRNNLRTAYAYSDYVMMCAERMNVDQVIRQIVDQYAQADRFMPNKVESA